MFCAQNRFIATLILTLTFVVTAGASSNNASSVSRVFGPAQSEIRAQALVGESITSQDNQMVTTQTVDTEVNDQPGCYDPMSDENMQPHYSEEFVESINHLLLKVYFNNNADPRLIFHRMIGETGTGDPDIVSTSVYRDFGVFQLVAGFYRQDSHKSRIEAMYPDNSTREQRRYVQVQYYTENYIPEGIAGIGWEQTGTCRPAGVPIAEGQRIWDGLTRREQAAYLGMGNCSGGSGLAVEAGIHNGEVDSYDLSFIQSFENGVPLCESWLNSEASPLEEGSDDVVD